MTDREIIIAAFAVLECEPGCSLDEVRVSYRELSKVWHLDRFDGDPKLKAKATEKMKSINNAYRLLEGFLETLQRHNEGSHRDSTKATPPSTEAADGFGRAQQSGHKHEADGEKVTITKERDPESGRLFFQKVVQNVKGHNGRWVSTQTKAFKTKPIDPEDSFDFAAAHSMSFTLSPEQGQKVKHWD